MVQFLVLAYDDTDAGAPERRLAARPAHFEGLKPMVEKGEIRAGGAILDDKGAMVGSAVLADFPSRADLDAWLAREPYMQKGVWKRVEVQPFRIAVLAGAVMP